MPISLSKNVGIGQFWYFLTSTKMYFGLFLHKLRSFESDDLLINQMGVLKMKKSLKTLRITFICKKRIRKIENVDMKDNYIGTL